MQRLKSSLCAAVVPLLSVILMPGVLDSKWFSGSNCRRKPEEEEELEELVTVVCVSDCEQENMHLHQCNQLLAI